MESSKRQQFQNYFYIFLGGFLGLLASLFFLHLIHAVAMGEFSAVGQNLDLISFFKETPERRIEALGILLSFFLLGIASGIIGVIRQELKTGKERIELLEKVGQTKTEFISLASHQLRAPLTAIKWSLKMMLAGDFGRLDLEQEKIVSRNIEANERLIVLVRDLLDISRIEQQHFEIHMKPISLSKAKQIIKKIVDELETQVKKKGLFLSLNAGVLSEKQILIDPDKIIQVIQNLLENAINYTPKGGKVQIKIEEKHNNLLVRISDTGIGIPKKEREKIFTKFFRAINARQRRSEGTGLGLYLCKTLIEMQSGKIWFDSEENRGATFSFSLPLQGTTPTEEFLRKL